jgi:hypothetical protein
VPESQMNFGDMNFTGGIQNFGGENTNTQNNYYEATPREQVGDLLAAIRAAHPDPELATRETAAIEGEIADPSPAARGRVEAGLKRLADSAGSARTVVEAAAAVGVIVAAQWPF